MSSRKIKKPLKRPKYCPELALAKAKKRKHEVSVMQELNETVQRTPHFPNLLSTTNESELHGLNDAAMELLLLSKLGLKGIFAFQHAMCVTPSNIPDRDCILLSLMQKSAR